MKLAITHTTAFAYTQPLLYAMQTLHLWPSSGDTQTVLDWSIHTPGVLDALPDVLGNRLHSVCVTATADQACVHHQIQVQGVVQTQDRAQWQDAPGAMHPALFQRPGELTQPDPVVAHWAPSVLGSTEVSVANALQLCHAVADRVRYESGVTEVRTTAAQAFAAGRGVCQDQAHVMVLAARSLGWSARYVSGYFWADQEPDLASHAWVDVCLSPADGHWLSLDVTHRCPTDERHVRLAASTDYRACAPVRGVRRGGGEETLSVRVSIEPLLSA
jgi:transglutaminase-like putative cysteine protease